MAAKVTVLRTDKDERGVRIHRVLYYYTIPTTNPITDFNGLKVAPQSRNELPPEVGTYLSEADKLAIDVGDAGFEQFLRQHTNGETASALVSRLLTDHATCEASWIAQKREQFAQAGRGVS